MLCVCFLCFLCARWDLFQAYVQEAVRDSREMKFRLDHRFFGTFMCSTFWTWTSQIESSLWT